MTPLTEAELLRMREVQAKASPGPWRVGWTRWWRGVDGSEGRYVWAGAEGDFACDPQTPHIEFYGRDVMENATLVASARTDWPRVTEWALEARRVLARYLNACDAPVGGCKTCDEARRLLGE